MHVSNTFHGFRTIWKVVERRVLYWEFVLGSNRASDAIFSVVHMICYLRYISNVSTMSCLRLRSKTLNYDVVHHSTPDCQFHLRWINFLALWGASWVPLLPIVLGLALLFPVFDIFLVECCCISAVGAAVLSIQSGSCKCCCSVFLSKCPDWFMTGEKTSETAVPKKIEKLL